MLTLIGLTPARKKTRNQSTCLGCGSSTREMSLKEPSFISEYTAPVYKNLFFGNLIIDFCSLRAPSLIYIWCRHGKSFHLCNNYNYYQIHVKFVSRYYFHSSLRTSDQVADNSIYICHNTIKPKCVSNIRLVCEFGLFLGEGWGSYHIQFGQLFISILKCLSKTYFYLLPN